MLNHRYESHDLSGLSAGRIKLVLLTAFKVSGKLLIHMFSLCKACMMQCLNPRHTQLVLLREPGDSTLQ